MPVWSLYCWENCSCLVIPTSQPVERKGGVKRWEGWRRGRGEGICAAPTKQWLLERWQKHLSSPDFTHSPAVRGADALHLPPLLLLTFSCLSHLSEFPCCCVKLLGTSFRNLIRCVSPTVAFNGSEPSELLLRSKISNQRAQIYFSHLLLRNLMRITSKHPPCRKTFRLHLAKFLTNQSLFINKYCCDVNECTDLSCDYFIIFPVAPPSTPPTCWGIASSKEKDANPCVWHTHRLKDTIAHLCPPRWPSDDVTRTCAKTQIQWFCAKLGKIR